MGLLDKLETMQMSDWEREQKIKEIVEDSLSDGNFSQMERAEVLQQARKYKISEIKAAAIINEAIKSYMGKIIARAAYDGQISNAERQDIMRKAEGLGMDSTDVTLMIEHAIEDRVNTVRSEEQLKNTVRDTAAFIGAGASKLFGSIRGAVNERKANQAAPQMNNIQSQPSNNLMDSKEKRRQLDKLIDAALADGNISAKERRVLSDKAFELVGMDTDEFDIMLDARIQEYQQEHMQQAMGNPMMGNPMMQQAPGMQVPVQSTFMMNVNGQQFGPYSVQQLQSMIPTGQFTAQTMVWKQGMSSWLPAAQVPELSYLFAQAAPAPGMPPIPGSGMPPMPGSGMPPMPGM